MKLYTSDPDIPYTTTKILPVRTKSDIDAILARWGITDVAWSFDPDNNKVRLQFQLTEKFQDQILNPVIAIEPPRIWNKQTRRNEESINWAVSMRVFYWYIKNNLAMAYAMQSEKTIAFLPYVIASRSGETVKDILIPNLEQLQRLKALPEVEAEIEERTNERRTAIRT